MSNVGRGRAESGDSPGGELLPPIGGKRLGKEHCLKPGNTKTTGEGPPTGAGSQLEDRASARPLRGWTSQPQEQAGLWRLHTPASLSHLPAMPPASPYKVEKKAGGTGGMCGEYPAQPARR